MRRIAVMLAVLLMALPLCARAGEARTDSGAAEESGIKDSLRDAWQIFSASFSEAFEGAYDEEVLRDMCSAVSARMADAGAKTGGYISAQLARIRSGMHAADTAVASWLDKHSADIGEAAEAVGAGLGEAANTVGQFMTSLFD